MLQDIGGADSNLHAQLVFLKCSRGCFHKESKSTATAALHVKNFVREAAQGLNLLREAQSRDISGPKKSKYLPQKFYLLTIREGSLTSYLLQENLEIVAVLLFIIPVANQVSSPGVELCRG